MKKYMYRFFSFIVAFSVFTQMWQPVYALEESENEEEEIEEVEETEKEIINKLHSLIINSQEESEINIELEFEDSHSVSQLSLLVKKEPQKEVPSTTTIEGIEDIFLFQENLDEDIIVIENPTHEEQESFIFHHSFEEGNYYVQAIVFKQDYCFYIMELGKEDVLSFMVEFENIKEDEKTEALEEIEAKEEREAYEAKIKGYSLSLGGDISLHFHLALEQDLVNDPSTKMVFYLPNGKEEEVSISNAIFKNGYYRFACHVSAKDISGNIHASLVKQDVILEEQLYSVESYLQYLLENSSRYDSKTDAVAQTLLEYGKAAQVYFDGTSVENSLSSVLVEPTIFGSDSFEKINNFIGARLLLNSSFGMKLYFKEGSVFKVDDVLVEPIQESNYKVISIPNLNPRNLMKVYKIQVDSEMMEYSPAYYGKQAMASNKKDLQILMQTLYNYYLALELESYLITYELFGGSNSLENPEVYCEDSETITLKEPTRKGYKFAGWYTDSSFGHPQNTILKGSKMDYTFFAKWNPIQYKILFDGNGESQGQMEEINEAFYDQEIVLPENEFVKNPYSFVGWNTEKDGLGIDIMDEETIKNLTDVDQEVVTLFAKWERRTNITELEKNSANYIAHRGLNTEAPENTVAAFRLAGERGFWGCETDVYITKDRQFVLNHNKTFKSTLGVSKTARQMTLKEIQSYKLISGTNYEAYKNNPEGNRIASLPEYLNICLEYNMVPIIELKDGAHANVTDPSYEELTLLYNQVKAIMKDKPVQFIGFDYYNLTAMRSILNENEDSQTRLQYLGHEPNIEAAVTLEELQNNKIGVNVSVTSVTESFVKKCVEKSIEVLAWTCDSIEQAIELINWGVDSLTSNIKLWN